MFPHNGSARARMIEVVLRNTIFGTLPFEMRTEIFDHLGLGSGPANGLAGASVPPSSILTNEAHPAMVPPPNDSSPFMLLPAELRREIFVRELGAKDVEHSPHCGVEDHSDRHCAKNGTPPPASHNRSSDLMTLNTKICNEVAAVIYEERYFVIHIHEGLRQGGIEFLDEGRQKLQYQEDVQEDTRFARFRLGEHFGFDRLKKIKIIIFPPASDEPENRHMQINTFFMTWALCQLLLRSEAKNELKHISIEFASPQVDGEALPGRRAIAAAESYCWDPLLKKPLATSIQWLPNIEVLLRPFSILRTHNIEISLPEKLRHHEDTKDFVARLRRRMLSTHGNLGEYDDGLMDEDYAHTIRGLSGDFNRYMFDTLHDGGKGYTVEDLDANALLDDDEYEDMKHGLSPTTTEQAGDVKRRKGERTKKRDEVLEAFMEEEDVDLQRALAASLEDSSLPRGKARTDTPSIQGTTPRHHDTSSSSLFSTAGRTLGSATTVHDAPPSFMSARIHDGPRQRPPQQHRVLGSSASDSIDDPFGNARAASHASSDAVSRRICYSLRDLHGGPRGGNPRWFPTSISPGPATPAHARVAPPTALPSQLVGESEETDEKDDSTEAVRREKLRNWQSIASSEKVLRR